MEGGSEREREEDEASEAVGALVRQDRVREIQAQITERKAES